MNSIAGYFAAPLRDLSAFGLIQLQWAGFAMAGGKFIAVQHAFRDYSLGEKLRITLVALPYDLLMYAVLFLVISVLGLLELKNRAARLAVLLLIQFVTLAVLICSFANVEFFSSLGSPLNYHLIIISPDLAGYLALSGISNASGALGPLVVLILLALLGSPFLFIKFSERLRNGRSWSKGVKLVGMTAVLLFGVTFCLPVDGYRQMELVNLSISTMLAGSAEPDKGKLALPTEAEVQALKKLLGPSSDEGVNAFATLPKEKFNVLIWVWESVGERYLRSHHPLGVVETPNLDAIAQKGCVQFKNCFVECPLTVQTAWALLSGISPPNFPMVFMHSELPSHPKFLPLVFKEAGYRTAHVNTSEPQIWRLDRTLKACQFDLYADLGKLPDGGEKPVAHTGWGVEDTTLGPAFFNWLDQQPKEKPFFAMTWNIETHHPYTWKDMPAELSNAEPFARYQAAIKRSDALFGEFYANLVKRGLDKDTLVIVVGDHGEGFGRAPWSNDQAHSMLVYEDDLHVPLMILNPALPKGQQPLSMNCTVTDLYPTLADLCGLEAPAGLQGASLARPFSGKPIYSRSIMMYPAAVRVGEYKLQIHLPRTPPELYRWTQDPTEKVNRAEQNVEMARLLAGNLTRWLTERFEQNEAQQQGAKTPP